jgi:hypothetical protein
LRKEEGSKEQDTAGSMDHGTPRDMRRAEMLLDRHDQEYGGEPEEQEFHVVQDVDGMISKDSS